MQPRCPRRGGLAGVAFPGGVLHKVSERKGVAPMLLPQSHPMWLSKFQPARDCRGRQRANRRSAVHFLDLESLEDRTVLSSITPTTFADGGAGSGSLRAAIIADNADPGTATDTINLNSGTYSLTLQNPGGVQENAAVTGDLDITSTAHTLIIKGQGTSGPGATIIDASTLLDRVFQIVKPGTQVELDGLVIKGGLAQDDGTAGVTAGSTTAEGGGILNNGGTLRLNNVVLDSDTALGGAGAAGGFDVPRGGTGQDARGGGLYSSGGSVTLADSTLSNDNAQGGGGGTGGDGQGGGLYSSGGSVTLTNSTLSNDKAQGGVGGTVSPTNSTLSNDNVQGGAGGDGQGGGLYSSGGSVTLADSTLSNDKAQGGFGGTGRRVVVGVVVGVGVGTGGDGQGGGLYSSSGSVVTLENSRVTFDTAQGGNGGNGGFGLGA